MHEKDTDHMVAPVTRPVFGCLFLRQLSKGIINLVKVLWEAADSRLLTTRQWFLPRQPDECPVPGGYIPTLETKQRECWKFLDSPLNSEIDSRVHGQPSII